MTKPGNTILISAQNKSYFITCTILGVHQYYHGYVVNDNAKTCTTNDDMLYAYQVVL